MENNNGVVNGTKTQSGASVEMRNFIINLSEDKRKAMKLQMTYSFLLSNKEGVKSDSIGNPVRKSYKINSISFFLNDIEMFEKTWTEIGGKVETKEYFGGLAVFMHLVLNLPNGDQYIQHITFTCTDFD